MKTAWWLVLLLPFSGSASSTGPSDFEWRYPIEASLAAGQTYRMEIPAEVYGRSQAFPDDIRIFDEDRRAWPFFIEPAPSRYVTHSVKSEQVNQAWVEGNASYQRIDLIVRPHHEETPRPRHNHLLVQTTGEEYIRRVEVLGSDDQKTWALLGSGYLLHVSQPRSIYEQRIHYPLSDYPFLQVRVFPNARNALERFEVKSAVVHHEEPNAPSTRSLAYRSLPVPPTEQPVGAQTLILDLGYERVPVGGVRLVASGDYVRRVVVSARNTEHESWRYVQAGDIHRIGSVIKEDVQAATTARFLKVDLYHYDDPPLSLETVAVTATRPYLVFEAASAGPALLYVGAPLVEGGRYDLIRRLAGSAGSNQLVATLGVGAANPGYRSTGYGSWGRWLAMAAVGGASLAVLWVVVRMFRRMTEKPPAE